MKLDDEYQGYAKSKFVSSQWTAEFTTTLFARPQLIERQTTLGEGYMADGVPKCDVCNHRKHVPTFAIRFQGKAYHKDSLDEVDQESSDSDEAEDEDMRSVDGNGTELPSEDKEWFSGVYVTVSLFSSPVPILPN